MAHERSKCCKAAVGYDAWVDLSGDVVGGPYDNCMCMECGKEDPEVEELASETSMAQKPSMDTVEANARLIAAAPDLLETLKLLWGVVFAGGTIGEAMEDQIEAAIAKAEGR